MKKILVLVMFCATAFLTGCEGPEGPRGPQGNSGAILEAEVYELLNVDFAINNGEYSIYRTLNILDSDVILMYRLSGTIDSQTPIWQPLPRTLFLEEGELDYDFDFSSEDYSIYAGGTYNLATTPQYLNDQTFRIVVIPGSFQRRSQAVDLNDYEAVIKAYNLEGKDVIQLN